MDTYHTLQTIVHTLVILDIPLPPAMEPQPPSASIAPIEPNCQAASEQDAREDARHMRNIENMNRTQVNTLNPGLCLGCGGTDQESFSVCESCGAPVEPRDESSHYSFGEWHEGCRQQCLECNGTARQTLEEVATRSDLNATEAIPSTPTITPPNQVQRHLTETEQSLHLAQANTPNSASFLDEANKKIIYTNEPVVIRAEGAGMLTKGDNTTASEFRDIEHQPGPEGTSEHMDDQECEMCDIRTQCAMVTCTSCSRRDRVGHTTAKGYWK